MRSFVARILTVYAVCMGWAGATSADGTVWMSPWRWSAPLVVGYNDVARIGPDGSVYVSQPIDDFSHVSRISSDGTLLWSRDAYLYLESSEADKLIAGSNGDLILGDSFAFAYLDSTGTTRWSRDQSFAEVGALGADRLATANCGQSSGVRVVSVRDKATGLVLWHHSAKLLSVAGTCGVRRPLGDPSGNVYVSADLSIGGTSSGRLARFSSSGSVQWDIQTRLVPFLATDSLFFAGINGSIGAFHATDASPAWTSPGQWRAEAGWVQAGNDLIAAVGAGIARIDGSNGTVKWTAPASPVLIARELIANRLVAVTGSAGSYSVVRIDANSGEILSTTPLPSEMWTFAAFGRLANGSIGVLGTQGLDTDAPVTLLHRVDANSGALLAPVSMPVVPSKLAAAVVNTVDPSGDIVGASLTRNSNGTVLRLRRVQAATGNELWQAAQPTVVDLYACGAPSVVAGAEAVAAAWRTEANASFPYSSDSAWVTVVDRATGALRWTVALADIYGQRSTNLSDIAIDTAGNFYIGMVTYAACYLGDTNFSCPSATIRKLDKVDGHEIWRRETTTPNPLTGTPLLSIVGSSVVTGGEFDLPADPHKIVGLSLLDGTPQWRSPTLGTEGVWFVVGVDSSHVIANHSAGNSRVAVGTGQVEWTVPRSPSNCAGGGCTGYTAAVLGDGSYLGAGEQNYAPYITVLRGDGSGRQDLNLATADTNLRGFFSGAMVEADGSVLMRLARNLRNQKAGLRALTPYLPLTNALGAQQVFSPRLVDTLTDTNYAIPLRRVDSTHLLMDAWQWKDGVDATSGSGVALFDTSVTAEGDVSMQLSTDRATTSPNRALPFHVTVSYSGSAAINEAQLIVALPPHTGVLDLACNAGCTIDQRSSNAHVRFGLQPGTSLTLSGKLRVLPASDTAPLPISATVVGPIGLRETDTVNNLAQSNIVVGLFSDSFESD